MQKLTATVTGVFVASTLPTHTVPELPVKQPPAAGFHVPDATGMPPATHSEVAVPAKATVNDHADPDATPVIVNGPEQPSPVADPTPASCPKPDGAAGAADPDHAESAAASAVAARIRRVFGTSVVPWFHGRAGHPARVVPRNA